MNAVEELEQIAVRLQEVAQRGDSAEVAGPLSALQESAEDVGKSASGSWLGYHALVYYEGFKRPPPSSYFDMEYGLTLKNSASIPWIQSTEEEVIKEIHRRAGDPKLDPARAFDANARLQVEMCKSEMLSIIQTHTDHDDRHLESIKTKINDTSLALREDVISEHAPRQLPTMDQIALYQQQQTPPHICIWAEVFAMNHTRETIKRLIRLVEQAASHLLRRQAVSYQKATVGPNIFIGHGRSAAWRELKDFIEDRLGLRTDEFNRVPIAGVSNVKRLEEILSSAAFAFLVMTGEDDQPDGTSHARLNVVHEAGLFQGKLGFERAIVLLEAGCKEFSNIAGLGQLRYAKGRISDKFEDVRLVLEREGLVKEGGK